MQLRALYLLLGRPAEPVLTRPGAAHSFGGRYRRRRRPASTRALVQAGIAVHEVRPRERTLEDAFFALTGVGLGIDEEATS